MSIQRLAASAAAFALCAALAGHAGAAPAEDSAAAGPAPFEVTDGADRAADAPASAIVDRTPLTGPAAPILSQRTALGQRLAAAGDLERFYRARGGDLAWVRNGQLSAQARELIEAVKASEAHGLNPAAYHLAALTGAADARGRIDDAALAETDVLMSDAFMLLARHLLNGRVAPSALPSDVRPASDTRDLAAALDDVLAGGDIERTLDGFAPQHEQYALLKAAYQSVARAAETESWPTVADGETLEIGVSDARVQQVRARLDAEAAFSGDGGADITPPSTHAEVEADTTDAQPNAAPANVQTTSADLYDEALAERVKTFQARHGLAVDGKVGPKTRAMLNQGLTERAQAIQMSMERWRWLPENLGDRYLLVNVPEYQVRGYEDGRESIAMDVIVGRTDRQTPQFSDEMEYIVVNPNWNVPYNIAVSDKLPILRRDPGYFDRNGYAIYRDGQRVSPTAVNWSAYSRGNFPFRIVQKPGRNNALGTIKFIFPNADNIYLHDTDAPHLFARNNRALSSGCVRVSDPEGLARWIADRDPQMTFGALNASWSSGRTDTQYLGQPLKVHLAYFTAWAGENGEINYYGDIYGRDDRLRTAMYAGS